MTRLIEIDTCVVVTEFSGPRLYPWLKNEEIPINDKNLHEIRVRAVGSNRYSGVPPSPPGNGEYPYGDYDTIFDARDACNEYVGRQFEAYVGYALAENRFPDHPEYGEDYFGITNLMPRFTGWIRSADGLKRDPIRIVFHFVPALGYERAETLDPFSRTWSDDWRTIALSCFSGVTPTETLLLNGPFTNEDWNCGGPGIFFPFIHTDGISPALEYDTVNYVRHMTLRRLPGLPDEYPRSYFSMAIVGGCSISVVRVPRPPRDDDLWEDLVPYELDPNYRYLDATRRYVIRQPTPWVHQTGVGYKVLQSYETGYRTEVVKYPLNPAVRQGDANYSSKPFWEAAYRKAVDEGTMREGLVYGRDYPKFVSEGYYRTYVKCRLRGIPLLNFPCVESINASSLNVAAINDMPCYGVDSVDHGDTSGSIEPFVDEETYKLSMTRKRTGLTPVEQQGTTRPPEGGEIVCAPNIPGSSTCIAGDDPLMPPCNRGN